MSGAGVMAVAQDAWLVHTEGADWPPTRDWGYRIRRQTEAWAHDFARASKRDLADEAAVVFGDRCEASVREPMGAPSVDLGPF